MDIEQGLKEQKDFIEKWNFDKVKNMTLEEYTNNDKDGSFCYWVEFKTDRTSS